MGPVRQSDSKQSTAGARIQDRDFRKGADTDGKTKEVQSRLKKNTKNHQKNLWLLYLSVKKNLALRCQGTNFTKNCTYNFDHTDSLVCTVRLHGLIVKKIYHYTTYDCILITICNVKRGKELTTHNYFRMTVKSCGKMLASSGFLHKSTYKIQCFV